MNSDMESKVPMLEKRVTKSNRKLKQYLAAITVSIGAFAVGTVLSWTSAALPYITQKTDSLIPNTTESRPYPHFTISHKEEALVGALLTLGALISAIPSGYLADKYGRKPILMGLSGPIFLNWVLITYAKNVIMLMIARFTAGLAVGGFCVVAPMYIGEIAETSCRGTFGSFFQMFLSAGILFTCIVGSVTNWISLSMVLGFVPIIFVLTFYIMPESPVYLIKKNMIFDAEIILKELHGAKAEVLEELKCMHKDFQANTKPVSLKGILQNKGYIKAIVSVVGILAFQQLSGINAIIFYTIPIFQAAGSSLSPNIAAIIINTVQVAISYVSIFIIEKADRKLYLLLSSVSMFFCLLSLGLFFHLKYLNIEATGFLEVIPVASTVIFMTAFAIGFGPIPWMLMGELFAPEIKGIGSGIAILTNWIFAFIITFGFPIITLSFGAHAAFYILAGFMLMATVFVLFVVPETRGKSLIEIQRDLGT